MNITKEEALARFNKVLAVYKYCQAKAIILVLTAIIWEAFAIGSAWHIPITEEQRVMCVVCLALMTYYLQIAALFIHDWQTRNILKRVIREIETTDQLDDTQAKDI